MSKFVEFFEKFFPKKGVGHEVMIREGTPVHEIKSFKSEVEKSKEGKYVLGKIEAVEILPTRVDGFDDLIDDGGFERGSTILISGGAGTGKTTFSMHMLYYGALKGEKGIYISFEEDPKKIKAHMKKNFGWDFYELEKKGLIAFIKIDPLKIARKIEAQILQGIAGTEIQIEQLPFPFKPDRVIVDSLSALGITFEDEENYRRYVRHMFEDLEGYNSVNIVLTETEQQPKVYSRAGIEEFLADGVIVFYNITKGKHRQNFIEILKLRSSNHERDLMEYEIRSDGIKVLEKCKK
ncbi:MAG: ATPase domain-containing protein [Candidatus Diapherotrites archaeon]|nr:ATPase domain-containing protein [Candidatus Diapherotrites archaeon]